MAFKKAYKNAVEHYSDIKNIVNTGDANAVASEIVSGKTAYVQGEKITGTGSTGGTDVSDTTATAAGVLSGLYFYSSAGVKTEGTITSKAAATYTPGTANQTIASGQYLSGDQTISGDANLTAGNIANGVTIFGVTGTHSGGTDVSDTTAVAGDVLSGKLFHIANGTAVNGTITSKSAQTYTPTTTDQTIAAGQYLSGAQTISGDANLVAANIAKDVTIFGVTGTHEGGSGTSESWYKCASVSSATWTGYKAVLSGGKYSYEASLTSDTLTFDSSKFTPVVGKTYSADALIEATLWTGIPLNGLIFYEPFTADASAAETGQTYTKTGTLTFAMDSTLGCNVATFDGSSKLAFPLSDMPTGANPWSFSVWLYESVSKASTDQDPIFGYGDSSSSTETRKLWFGICDTAADLGTHGSGSWGFSSADSAITLNTWTHYAITYDGSYVKFYKNGALTGTSESHTLSTYQTSTDASIGTYGSWSSDTFYTGKMSSFRIYSRALSAAEVTWLYQEH